MLSEDEKHAIAFYDEQARAGNPVGGEIWADEFIQHTFLGIGEEEEVLDVGCGTGRCIKVMETLGINRIFGVDPSIESVKYCRKHFPKYTFELDEFRTIGDHYPNRFGGFITVSTIMHIPRTDIMEAIASLRKSLKVGARGFFHSPESFDGITSAKSIVGNMTINLYTQEELYDVFSQNGFRVVGMDPYEPIKGAVVAI